ncbi:hypothetical protein CR513_41061, partial [Mucuna pruriens]
MARRICPKLFACYFGPFKILSEVGNNPTSQPNCSLHHGIMLYKNRLVILSTLPIMHTLLQEFHSTCIGGHSRYMRTYK